MNKLSLVHHKDITGFEIERALLETVNNSPNIEILPHHYVIDLITQHHVPGKEFDKLQHHFKIKSLGKLRVEKNCLNLIKGIYKNLYLRPSVDEKVWSVFPLSSETR